MRFERFFHQDASCPPPPEPTREQLKTEGAALMQAAGIRTCETSQSSMTAEAHGSVKIPFAGADFGMSMTSNKSSTIGCEQVAVITDKYRKAVTNVTCLLKKTTNKVTNSASGINSVEFKAGRDMDVMCNGKEGLSIKQKMQIDLISQITLSQAELNQIQSACKDVVKTIADTAMNSKQGLGATPQGQKMIKDTLTDIQQTDYTANISETLNETTTKLAGENTILFTAGRDLKISGTRCVFEQDMIIKMVAASTVDSTISNMMEQMSDTLNDTSVKTEAKSDNRGADDLANAVKTPTPDYGLISTKTMIIIAVIVGIVVIGGVIVAVVKSSKSSAPSSSSSPSSTSSSSTPSSSSSSSAPSSYLRQRLSNLLPKQQIQTKETNPFVLFAVIVFIILLLKKRNENYRNLEEDKPVFKGF